MLGWKIAREGLFCNDSEEDRLFSELHLYMGNHFGARSEKGGGALCLEMGFTLMFLANLLTYGLLNLNKIQFENMLQNDFKLCFWCCILRQKKCPHKHHINTQWMGGDFDLAWTTSVCRMIHYYRK